jgi:hypothetical protein
MLKFASCMVCLNADECNNQSTFFLRGSNQSTGDGVVSG